MEKLPSSIYRVRFQDCDPLGHLNNAKYLECFINAREEHLLHYYGLNVLSDMLETNKAWVVFRHELSYFRPALLNETVHIESKITDLEKQSLTVEMKMWDKDKAKLKASLKTSYVHYDLKLSKATPMDVELFDLFQRLI